eukprot:TRINITY_DN10521_c0_g1_i1.p3 TRINITY_DN10521_c0_g1~~TRINITY_DN10521_c0_g1_i1.p3  ORF type:complete len:117 (+),score=14.23 TRINITY_DN10521_c0_g1_i1:168-518(+)
MSFAEGSSEQLSDSLVRGDRLGRSANFHRDEALAEKLLHLRGQLHVDTVRQLQFVTNGVGTVFAPRPNSLRAAVGNASNMEVPGVAVVVASVATGTFDRRRPWRWTALSEGFSCSG